MIVYDVQTVAAVCALISSAVFALLYSRVTWWKGQTGRNLMAMALCLVVLAAGSVTRRLINVELGHYILLAGWVFVAVVMAWRTAQMWRVTHPDNAPKQKPKKTWSRRQAPSEPVSPTPPKSRQWYTPTPYSANSVLEPPRKENKK